MIPREWLVKTCDLSLVGAAKESLKRAHEGTSPYKPVSLQALAKRRDEISSQPCEENWPERACDCRDPDEHFLSVDKPF
jgi:hypothetical protein